MQSTWQKYNPMNVLLIDNYDSFTYNLVQYMEQIEGLQISVFRNDAISIADVAIYDILVFSPGPGIPDEAGKMKDIIQTYAGIKPMLGICLGHQAIAEVFGATLLNLETVFHGLATPINLASPDFIFDGMEVPLLVGRYHSWVVNPKDLPDNLIITARDENGDIMALRHAEYEIHGLQFHPESLLTPRGMDLLRNFFRPYLSQSAKASKQNMITA